MTSASLVEVWLSNNMRDAEIVDVCPEFCSEEFQFCSFGQDMASILLFCFHYWNDECDLNALLTD